MPTDKPRYTITVDPDLQKQIEDFQFNNRFKSQTKAIISLMELGLKKLQTDLPIHEDQSATEIEEYTPDEQQLIDDYRTLNDQGKEHIRVCMASAQALFKENSADISSLESKSS